MSIKGYVTQVTFLLLSKRVRKNHQSKMYELNVTPQEITNYNVSFSKRLFYADQHDYQTLILQVAG